MRSENNARKICLVVENESRGIVGYAWVKWESDNCASSDFGIYVRGDYKESGDVTVRERLQAPGRFE